MTAPVHHRTPWPGGSPPHVRNTSPSRRSPRPTPRPTPRVVRAALAAAVLLGSVIALAVAGPEAGSTAIAVLAVFAAAVWFWVFTDVDDTFVALGAAVVLTVLGMSDADALFGSLGDDTMWLLIAAFIIAFAVSSSGLATRAAAFVVTAARGPRSLVHLLTIALVATAFAVPSTSGRAALALPVFLALAHVLADRPALVRSSRPACSARTSTRRSPPPTW